jgi:Spy/CpxP family protein refolding chaperone
MKQTIVSTILIVFLLAAFCWAQPPRQEMCKMGQGVERPDRPDRSCCGMGEMKCGQNIPDLTDAQKAQLEKLQIEHMKSMQPLQNELAEKQAQLHTLTTAAEVSMSRINSLIEEIGKLKTEMVKVREKHHQDVRKMLDEKQRLFFDNQSGHRFGMDR